MMARAYFELLVAIIVKLSVSNRDEKRGRRRGYRDPQYHHVAPRPQQQRTLELLRRSRFSCAGSLNQNSLCLASVVWKIVVLPINQASLLISLTKEEILFKELSNVLPAKNRFIAPHFYPFPTKILVVTSCHPSNTRSWVQKNTPPFSAFKTCRALYKC